MAIIFDGFDNQLLGFAIPAILRDWHVSRAAFGPVVASGLIGMSIGSLMAGPAGDRLGRRTALIGSVLLFAVVTLGTAAVQSIPLLGLFRFLAGAGIGGAIPNAAAIAAEFSALQHRALTVTLTIVCVPLGGMFGGFAAAQILPVWGWRALFAVGGVAPLALCVVLFLLLPESPGFLSSRGSGQHLSLAAVFGAGNLRDTLSLWLTSFCCLLCVYMSFSWLPTLLTTQGLSLAEASSGLALYNLGGVAGAVLCGAAIVRFGSRIPMLSAAFCASASALLLNFSGTTSHTVLLAGFAAHGLFVNAVQTTSFALGAHLYPTSARASGVAFALAVGRTGAVASAFLGAGLITAGRPAFLYFLALMMAGTFIGLALVRNHIPSRRILHRLPVSTT